MANDTRKQADASQQTAPPTPPLPEYRVQLLVDKGKGKGKGNGWETVQVGNDFYRYHFMGGNDGGGRIRVSNHEGPVPVTIELLQRNQDFSIELVAPLVDPNSQLKDCQRVDDNTWVINNKNDKPQQGYYLVKVAAKVKDGSSVTIDCDPMITNEPK